MVDAAGVASVADTVVEADEQYVDDTVAPADEQYVDEPYADEHYVDEQYAEDEYAETAEFGISATDEAHAAEAAFPEDGDLDWGIDEGEGVIGGGEDESALLPDEPDVMDMN